MTTKKSLSLLCLLLAAPILIVGCSEPNIGQISGRVTINGKPMTTGSITFNSKETGISVNANISEDGTYRVKTYKADGLPPGEYRIGIKSLSPSAGDDTLIGEGPVTQPAQTVFIPPKYQNAATSGFTAVVKKGENEPFNFDLK